jgi:hypothetical protein
VRTLFLSLPSGALSPLSICSPSSKSKKVHVVGDVFLDTYFMVSLGTLEGNAWLFNTKLPLKHLANAQSSTKPWIQFVLPLSGAFT